MHSATSASAASPPATAAAAAAAAAMSQPPPPLQSKSTTTQPPTSSAAPTSAATAERDAAFRRFFTQLSTADIHAAGNTAATANTGAAAAKSSSSASASAVPAAAAAASLHAPPHALEAYRQLHSSMPALHAHHLESLSSWLGAAFAARRLPRELAPGEPFSLSLTLIEAVRQQARLAPAHSRLTGTTAAAGSAVLKVAATAAGDEAEGPSFAEALAADAGKATAALSRRRGADGSASSSSSSASASSAAAKSDAAAAEVTLSAAANPVDSRMAAASQLYAVLLVQLLPLLLHPSSSSAAPAAAVSHSASSAPTAVTTTPRDFLRAIPRSLEAEARRLEAEAAAHLAAVVCFDDVIDEAPAAEGKDADDDDLGSNEAEGSDDDFTADPQPEDSSDDEGGETAAAATSVWGSLDSIPVEAHAIAALHAPSSSSTASSSGSDAVALRDQILQLISLWDADLFTLGSVWGDTRIDAHLVRTWELASRAREGAAFHPSVDAGSALDQLRHRILAVFRAGLLQREQASSTMQQMWTPLVSSVLGLPQCVPGMGDDPLALMSDLAESDGDEDSNSSGRFDPESTLISLLAQVCSATSPFVFPANPSAAGASSVASPVASASIAFLHGFVSHNLRWLSRRLGQLRGQFTELTDQARANWNSLRFAAPGLRRIVDQMREIVHTAAFWVSNHPTSARKATTDRQQQQQQQQQDDPGVRLIESGMLSHVVALVLLSNHDLFHSHAPATASGSSAGPEAYCTSCRAFEAARASTDVQLVASVTKQGEYVSEILPVLSAFAAAPASSSVVLAAAGSVALPSASPASNPLYFVHHFLLVACSSSTAVSLHLLAHPSFLPRLHCACYEEQHWVPALLLPLMISLNTRGLTIEEAARSALAGANAAASAASAPSASASAPAATVAKKKDKKSKLLVSALPVESDEKQADEMDSALDAPIASIGAASVSPLANNAQVLEALLKRCAHVLRSTLAALPVAAASVSASSSASSSVITAPSSAPAPAIDAAALSLQLQLLSHVVHHLALLSARSQQWKSVLLRLADPATAAGEYGCSSVSSVSASSAAAGPRSSECEQVSAILQLALKQLRAMLPQLSKQLSAEIATQSAPVLAVAATTGTDDAEAASAQLTALSAEADSAAGHSRRQAKQALDQCASAVQRMQQWCKNMAVEVAKKD